MKNMKLSNLAEACHGTLVGEANEIEASSVVIDSRKVTEGSVFIATKGERVDGHQFIEKAIDQGAIGIICEKEPEHCGVPYILVEDSFVALQDIAEFYRRQLSIPIIGITGSVGKTSTKEMIASVLAQKYKVLKTEGNFNNEIGLPLTILSIQEEHEVAVVEMGISHFGEMHRLSRIAKPDFCVLTNIGQCHLENLGTREGILKAKSEIFDFMNPDGYVFVNGDDDQLQKIQEQGTNEITHFGHDSSNDYYATEIVNLGLKGSTAEIHMKEDEKLAFTVSIPLPGLHMVNNALAATAVGRKLSLSVEQIQEGIRSVKATSGRSNVLFLEKWTVIDDCYNANPVSMRAAIDLLSLATTRKVAILGDMFELGDAEKELHAGIGSYASEREIDVIVCVGNLSKEMYETTLKEKKCKEIHYFETKEKLLKELPHILQEGDSILVKASHGMGFDEVVTVLKG